MKLHVPCVAATCLALVGAAPAAPGDERAPVEHWGLETGDGATGRFKLVDGVSGRALRLDGFTTLITARSERGLASTGALSVDAWVAPAAYPWNWCPIVAQEENRRKGYYFGLGPQGRIGLQLAVGGRWHSLESARPLPLRRWSHVAAVHDPGTGVRLYVDGALAGQLALQGPLEAARGAEVLIGANRDKVLPSDPVPPALGTLPSWFSLDGILDEVRVFDVALAADEVARAARPPVGLAPPDLPARVMPSGPPGPGRFGAYYTHLRFYDEWDALWPVADHPDVVVQFDGSPLRVVFWRGLRYSPAWVMENGLWLADQSGESGNHEGCVEHMQDIHTKYSSVRVLENSPARVVVHWRYAPVSAHDHNWRAETRTEWEWWVDEYYSFYPDGTAVRKVRWRTPEKERAFPWLQIQETSVLCHPGQHAKDVLRNDALTFFDAEGRRATYSWPDNAEENTRARRNMQPDPSIVRDLQPKAPVIQVVGMRSKAQPFIVFEPGNRPLVYVGRVRDEVTDFPAYNHWPVSQVRSDGRFAQAADRATSFSIAQNRPPRHTDPGGFEWVAMLYGATFDDTSTIVPLARSWITPPALRVRRGAVEDQGYDVGQRAYRLLCTGASPCPDLALELAATEGSPVRNAFLILERFGDGPVEVSMGGRRPEAGRTVRTARRRTLEGTDLLVWIEASSTTPVTVEISRPR